MHPVAFDIDYDMERNRLTTFFRLLVAIPWIIVSYVYGILATIAIIVAFFAMLFTKRYPQGLYKFNAGYLRFQARVGAFILLATDEFPAWWGSKEPDYPVRIDIGPPQAEYSRAKTFFKIILAFPQLVLSYGIGLIIMGAAFISWFRIVFTGKQSATMHDALVVGFAYSIRSSSFLYFLTEVHPRLLDLPVQGYPPGTPALPEATGGPAVLPEPAAPAV